jgi:hypothetical protein
MVTFIIGAAVGLAVGYRARMLYTRQLWRLSRSIKNKAKGL